MQQEYQELRIDHRSPITLWEVGQLVDSSIPKRGAYHFKRPHSPNPDLNWPIDPFHIVQLDTFPPASSGGLSPEEQEFLSHTYSVVVRQITSDISAKFRQSKAADDCLVGLRGAVAPLIFAIKASA